MNQVGVLPITIFITGTSVGVSLFSLSESLVIYGKYSWLGWIICTMCALSFVTIFAKLSERFSQGGGPYEYAQQTYGPRYALAIGIIHLLAIFIQLGSITHVLYMHFSKLVLSSSYIWMYVPIIISGILNSYNFTTSAYLITVFNTLKALPIILLIIFGIPYIDLNACMIPISGSSSPAMSICGSISMTLFAFSGIEYGVILNTSQIKDPKKTISRALWFGTILAAIFFIFVQMIVWSVPRAEGSTGAPLAHAALVVFNSLFGIGHIAYAVISVTGILFAYTALNGSLVIASHAIGAMANNGHLPACFKITNSPIAPVWLSIMITATFSFIFFHGLIGYEHMFRTIIEVSDLMLSIVFASTVFAYRKIIPSINIRYILGIISSSVLLLSSSASILNIMFFS